MLIANHKPIVLIGYEQSAMTQEFSRILHYNLSTKTNGKLDDLFQIIKPEEFLKIDDKSQNQYAVGFNLDLQLRQKVLDIIDHEDLDCVSAYTDRTVVEQDAKLGKGVIIGDMSYIASGCEIGDFFICEGMVLVGHFSKVGRNAMLHAGAMIAGRTVIGNNVIMNFRSSIINSLTICDDVELGAVSSITKNITEPGYYVGSPARKFPKLDQ